MVNMGQLWVKMHPFVRNLHSLPKLTVFSRRTVGIYSKANQTKGTIALKTKTIQVFFAKWKRFWRDNVNPAALRLLWGSQSEREIREAVVWERDH